jgi:pyruvate dehydrogenase E1 component
MYARAFLEGRLTENQLDGFRQELSHEGGGLSSYPHPRLMPDFWQFPTVSMGIGPLNAIYQARYNRYLHNRGIKDTSDQHVWAFLGDGEVDEVDTLGAIGLATREKLDNLLLTVTCNALMVRSAEMERLSKSLNQSLVVLAGMSLRLCGAVVGIHFWHRIAKAHL